MPNAMHVAVDPVSRIGRALQAIVMTLLLLAVSCGFQDAFLIADGQVIDAQGRPVAGAEVKTRNATAKSDALGCFHIDETTDPDKHQMPFAIEAPGLRPFTGSIDSPGYVRIQVLLVDAVSPDHSTIDVAPVAGALGACEPPVRGSAAR